MDFDSRDTSGRWSVVNDGVMGGISRSEMVRTDEGTALFRGRVRLEYNGGFASVRTSFPTGTLRNAEGVTLRVRGDGRTYQLRLRTDGRFDGVSHRHRFETARDMWTTVRLPFTDFVPTFRGRILRNVPPLSPGRIRQLGILIADEQAGPFELELDWIGAYR